MSRNYISISSPTQFVTKEVNITEKRAPTDESIKLLKEFEEKSFDKIVGTLEIRNTELHAIAIIFNNPLATASFKRKVRIIYKLNNKQFDQTIDLDYFEQDLDKLEQFELDPREIYIVFQKIIEVVSKSIAEYLITKEFNDYYPIYTQLKQ